MAVIPWCEPRSVEEHFERSLWLSWAISTLESETPPGEADWGGLEESEDPVAALADRESRAADWTRKRAELQSRLHAVLARTAIGKAHTQLRKIVVIAEEEIDRLVEEGGTSMVLEQSAAEGGDRTMRLKRLTDTLARCLTVLPEEITRPPLDRYVERTPEQARVLKMASAIEAGETDWRSAGAPPKGTPQTDMLIRVEDR